MTREEIIRNLKYVMEKHKNDTVNTFGTNISVMCKDILDYLEQEPKTGHWIEHENDVKPISYQDCSDALLKMWIENVLTDDEYYRIIEKLNKWQLRQQEQDDRG